MQSREEDIEMFQINTYHPHDKYFLKLSRELGQEKFKILISWFPTYTHFYECFNRTIKQVEKRRAIANAKKSASEPHE